MTDRMTEQAAFARQYTGDFHTADRTEAIRQRHLRVPSMDPTSFLCDFCEEIWPCDAAFLLARADALAAALEGVAEGARDGVPCWCPGWERPHQSYCIAARAALAAYRGET